MKDNKMKEFLDKFNNVNWDDDRSIIELIKESEDSIYTIRSANKNNGIIIIQENQLKVSIYQANGWIRSNIYTIDVDENVKEYLIREELYEK